jgi:hypothetical protein
LNVDQSFDISRVKEFAYYAEKLLRIKTEGDPKRKIPPQILPFKFKPAQLKLDKIIEEELKSKGRAWINILKARREGMSTYVEGRIFHHVVTNKNAGAFIVAHDTQGLNRIFNMSKLFYDELPARFKPLTRYVSKNELTFENPNDKSRAFEPGLRSSIEVFSANRGRAAARSGGFVAAHFSEVGLYDNAGELMTAVEASLENAVFRINESTAYGVGNYFHNTWVDGKKRRNNFRNVFFSYLEDPAYRLEFKSERAKKLFTSQLDDEEKMHISKYGATLEQLLWRRDKIANFSSDPDVDALDKFHQEYPVDDVEAFISAGRPYFNRARLREYMARVSEPIFVGRLSDTLGLIEDEYGELKIWEMPIEGAQYVLGVDVGEGNARSDQGVDMEYLDEGDGDYSVIEVLKVPSPGRPVEQVAEFVMRIDPVMLGKQLMVLGNFYNEGMLSIEVNNHGLTTLSEVKQHYWNLYRWQYLDHVGKYDSNKLGWVTNVSTRPHMCDYTSAAVNADMLAIRSEELVEEMNTFIKRGVGYGGEADSNCYDDRVMAYMIALITMAQSYQSSSLLEEMGQVPGHTQRHVKAEPLSDYERGYNEMMSVGDGRLGRETSWLNY